MATVLLRTTDGDEPVEVRLERADAAHEDHYEVTIGDRRLAATVEGDAARGRIRVDGAVSPYRAVRDGDTLHVWVDGTVHALQIVDRTARRANDALAAGAASDLTAPMPGTILKINAEAGLAFDAHEPLVVMESMKMEIPVEAPAAGTVVEVRVKPEDQVSEGDVLVVIEA